MKTYIYVDEEKTQIVLTPENQFERNIVNDFDLTNSEVKLFKGSFADCQGGWTRLYDRGEDSIIIKCNYNKKEV